MGIEQPEFDEEKAMKDLLIDAAKTGQTELDLSNKKLASLPAELGKLTNLITLVLDHNQLTAIPAELGKLTNLQRLSLDNNPKLTSPTVEVVEDGTEAILMYLQEQLGDKQGEVGSSMPVP
jgi:hypothetical protein